MKRYEFVFIVKPDLGTDKSKKLLDSLEEEVKKAGGKVEKQDSWGEKQLAYEIKKLRRGEYFLWRLSFAGAPRLDELNVFLNREESILRYLFIKER